MFNYFKKRREAKEERETLIKENQNKLLPYMVAKKLLKAKLDKDKSIRYVDVVTEIRDVYLKAPYNMELNDIEFNDYIDNRFINDIDYLNKTFEVSGYTREMINLLASRQRIDRFTRLNSPQELHYLLLDVLPTISVIIDEVLELKKQNIK